MLKNLFVAMLVLTMQPAFAQLQLGLKAGANFSNFTGGDFQNIETESLTRPYAGAYVRWRFANNLGLQPEVLFSEQGAKLKSGTDEFDAKVSYINIPIMLQYHFGNLYAELGPQVGFKLDEDTPDGASDDFVKSNDVALAVGLGFETKIGLGINARYIMGLTGVGNIESPDYDSDFKNGVFQLGLFYTFFNKKKVDQ
jgi:hypothetical protein